MCCCMIETSSVLPRKSSVIFGNLRESLVIAGNFWKIFGNICLTFRGVLRIFGNLRKVHENLWKIVKKSSLVRLYNKQNNSWLLVDMEFLFSYSTLYLMSELRSLMRYQVGHSKKNSISTLTLVLSST